MTLSYLITQAKYFESTKSGLIKEKKVTEFLLQR